MIVDYLLIGLIFYFYGDISEGSWSLVLVLCDVSSLHIHVRTLTDVIVAWRYGQRSHEMPYLRAKMVPFLIVAVLIILTFLIRGNPYQEEAIYCRSDMLVSSVILIIIPCCYHCTVERMMGKAEFKKAPKWWSYALYAGGVCSLIGFFSYFRQLNYDQIMIMMLTVNIDFVLAALVLLWHLLGRCLP